MHCQEFSADQMLRLILSSIYETEMIRVNGCVRGLRVRRSAITDIVMNDICLYCVRVESFINEWHTEIAQGTFRHHVEVLSETLLICSV